MKSPNCGAENPEHALFCGRCATELRRNLDSPKSDYVNEPESAPTPGPTAGDSTVSRRLEWIAVILFLANLFFMYLLCSLFYREDAWGLATIAVNTATSVILLLSVVLSIFGKTNLSKIAVGIGIMGLMITVVLL